MADSASPASPQQQPQQPPQQAPSGPLPDNRWVITKEAEIFSNWEKAGIYAFDPGKRQRVWTIDTPPPYASGTWHMGGAVHYASIDIIARYRRMKGYAVNYMMGIDRNGLPIEVQTEKEYKIRMYDTDRKHFLKLCRELLDKYESEILRVCKRLGCSNNSLSAEGVYRTDSPEYRAATQATFIDMWNKGYVFEDERPNNWCTDCGTTIADAEIDYKDVPSKLLHLKFAIKGAGGEHLVVATTRPEMLFACACVLVNPEDARYRKYHNKKLIVPIFDKEVPIIAHPEAAMNFGSGAVMICSYGDYTDVRLFRDLKLAPTKAITPDGKMTAAAGAYQGLRVNKARLQIAEDLEKAGHVVKIEQISHRTPVCWRSKTPIEFVTMPEYYLTQKDVVPQLREVADKLRFHPAQAKQILLDWLTSVSIDWPISRRRYYGTELPIWYCDKCKQVALPEPGKYYQPWVDDCPLKDCPKCGGKTFTGEKRTFDTWFDSSISELVVSGYLHNSGLFERSFPASVRPQGKDIVRTWLHYTLLRAYLLFKRPAFEHVWISGHVVDEKGEKMSKSVGNVVKPEPMLDRYGADALRLFASSEALLGSDLRFSEERLAGAAKFVQKLYNVSRFISTFPQAGKPKKLSPADAWILGLLDKVVEDADAGYAEMDFFVPGNRIKNFTWDVFASHYLELVKGRAYNRDGRFSAEEQESAHYALHQCLRTILKLLAPISPFVTEHVWLALYSEGGRSLHLEAFPEKLGLKADDAITAKLAEVNSLAWKAKKDAAKSMKDPLSELVIPQELELLSADLAAMHNALKVRTGAPAASI